MKKYPWHPAANLFPLMEPNELKKLAADITVKTQLIKIALCDGMVLDGRNRQEACEIAGVEPQYEQWTDPTGLGPTA